MLVQIIIIIIIIIIKIIIIIIIIRNRIANVGYPKKGMKLSLIISDCNKLAQNEFKNRLDWVGKVIH